MFLIKRAATFLVLFVCLFLLLFIGSLAVGGAMAGARAGAKGPQPTDYRSSFEQGRQAGAEFANQYRGIIFLGALSISGFASAAISFTGILPWCRRVPVPPPLA